MYKRVLCLLAGGQSRRFGSPKVEMVINDEPVISHIVGHIGGMFDQVWLSLADDLRPVTGAELCNRVVFDQRVDGGPLIGMKTVLSEAAQQGTVDRITFAAVDMPFVGAHVIQQLDERVKDGRYASAMATWSDGPRKGKIEPLPSAWEVQKGYELIALADQEGISSLQRVASMACVSQISLNWESDQRSYLNINYPKDLDRYADVDLKASRPRK